MTPTEPTNKSAADFVDWKFFGTVLENEVRVLEYGVTLAETVTAGVVSDDLSGFPSSPLRGVELR